MRKLVIPERLKIEFATIEAVWHSQAETRRVDALILAWVKFEKQLRRLFCFLVYQHPNINEDQIDRVLAVLAANRSIYPETFIKLINALKVTSISKMVGDKYEKLWEEITRIKKYRNKLIHGQNTGLKIQSPQLERDVLQIMEWISVLAEGADTAIGYDGIKRNTFRMAKASKNIVVNKYPFEHATEFKKWLTETTANG